MEKCVLYPCIPFNNLRLLNLSIIHKNCTAKEIWEYDNQKIILCKEKGYKLFRIKELDWLNDNINTKKFIKNIISEVNI